MARQSMALLRLLVAIVFTTATPSAWAQADQKRPSKNEDKRRTLTVVLYPFIPDHESYFYEVKQRFEDDHPDTKLQIVDLSDNYYDSGSPGAITNTYADVYELDTVFLDDMIQARKIQPLQASLNWKPGTYMPVADVASRANGHPYGAPHWLCSDFLFFPKGNKLRDARTLADVRADIGSSHAEGNGLLVDLKGASTLSELYLNAEISLHGSFKAALPYLDPNNIDLHAVNNLISLVPLCDRGLGRDKEYHNADGFYPRLFARGGGVALVGYAEAMGYVASESANATLRKEARHPDQVDVIPMTLTDKPYVPFAWVDAFTVSAHCSGRKLADATAFIQFITSRTEVQFALDQQDSPQFVSAAPRYVAPALSAFYSDKQWLSKFPLYASEGRVFRSAVNVHGVGIETKLRLVGKKIDALMPPNPYPTGQHQ